MTNERIERTTLKNLLFNEEYSRKVLPFIKEEYFTNRLEKILFKEIFNFTTQYNKLPTKETLEIDIQNRRDITDEEYKQIVELVQSLNSEEINLDWLVETTEKFCKDRAIHNAVMDGIQILENKDNKRTPEAIPEILSDALGVSFDSHVGHDYLDDVDKRFDYYHQKLERVEFDLEYFNKITKGGLPNKTLNVALAGTGVGKTMFMTHMAAHSLSVNKNVLYITMEMAEERIAERIDANLLNISTDDLHSLNRKIFSDKIEKLKQATTGSLVIKEYPTASAGAGHFKSLLNELALKKTFKPDIVFIDYINICASSRFKPGANVNSYTYVKAIAEELRGLAVESNLPIVTATQTTRTGFVSTDVGLEDTSESFGLPATADFMFALISNDELEQAGQMMVKQLKNRYNDPTMNKKFVIGVDRARMKFFDVEQSAQTLVNSGIDEDSDTDAVESYLQKNKGNKYGNFS